MNVLDHIPSDRQFVAGRQPEARTGNRTRLKALISAIARPKVPESPQQSPLSVERGRRIGEGEHAESPRIELRTPVTIHPLDPGIERLHRNQVRNRYNLWVLPLQGYQGVNENTLSTPLTEVMRCRQMHHGDIRIERVWTPAGHSVR
jgi:hypothetical protein